jgi:hypothetical protein
LQNLKEFIVFAFHNYYPSGGLEDIRLSYDEFEEAKHFIETAYTIDKRTGAKHWGYDSFQIVRKSDWQIVYEASVRTRTISST